MSVVRRHPAQVMRQRSEISYMRELRLILILIVGGCLTNLTYKSQFGSSFFDGFILIFLIVAGLVLLAWTIEKDIQLFKDRKNVASFSLTIVSLLFITVCLILNLSIDNNFVKPTLLKVFYDGDYNGTGIDFKKDGTYIFDNSAIGISDYYYGTYQINGDNITMDRDQIDNLTHLKYLKVINKQYGSDGPDLYLSQVDNAGNLSEHSDEYRVIVDNRVTKLQPRTSH